MTIDSAGSRPIIPSELRRSSDLSEMSRTETVRQDVRRLKSVTLGRMGKMFRTRTPVAERSSLDLDTVSDLDPRGVMFSKCKGFLRVRDAGASIISLMIYEGSLNPKMLSE